jgi:hypothetical protein
MTITARPQKFPVGATTDQLLAFAATHFRTVMWGAWLQAVGPWLIVSFALTLVKLSGRRTASPDG